MSFAISKWAKDQFHNWYSTTNQIRWTVRLALINMLNKMIAPMCPWPNSCVVVACAKIWCDMMVRNRMTPKTTFSSHFNCDEKKSLMRQAPGVIFQHSSQNTEIQGSSFTIGYKPVIVAEDGSLLNIIWRQEEAIKQEMWKRLNFRLWEVARNRFVNGLGILCEVHRVTLFHARYQWKGIVSYHDCEKFWMAWSIIAYILGTWMPFYYAGLSINNWLYVSLSLSPIYSCEYHVAYTQQQMQINRWNRCKSPCISIMVHALGPSYMYIYICIYIAVNLATMLSTNW